jgi:hypothetical protein
MADETVCATLLLKHLQRRSAGGFACEPIFSHLLTVAALLVPSRRLRGWLREQNDEL